LALVAAIAVAHRGVASLLPGPGFGVQAVMERGDVER
jgi:hypothetical protein